VSVETGQKPIDDINRKGDLAEYYAVTWLWDEGYEVFRNAGCTGPIDLIGVHLETGETLLIDVKTFYGNKKTGRDNYTGGAGRSKTQKKLGVVYLGFHPTTRKLRFVEHRETK
jgi:Holliday junction resolvase-like predicted endonuclease